MNQKEFIRRQQEYNCLYKIPEILVKPFQGITCILKPKNNICCVTSFSVPHKKSLNLQVHGLKCGDISYLVTSSFDYIDNQITQFSLADIRESISYAYIMWHPMMNLVIDVYNPTGEDLIMCGILGLRTYV